MFGILFINEALLGTRGSVAVEALWYKPDGRGFDSRIVVVAHQRVNMPLYDEPISVDPWLKFVTHAQTLAAGKRLCVGNQAYLAWRLNSLLELTITPLPGN
jgi:hypothetical protein